MPALGHQRDAFELPDDVAYFNTANIAPQLRSVRAAALDALEQRSRPWLVSAADWFADAEILRGLFARLIGAAADGVALIPATSYGFAVAARNLAVEAGQRIVVLAEEYPSGIYTWRAVARGAGAEIVTAERRPGQSWADAVLAVLDDRVAIVSVPNVHWTDGSLVDLPAVADAARDVGAALVIDAANPLE